MDKNERLVLILASASHLTVHSLMLVFPSILLVIQGQFDAGLGLLGFIATASAFMFGLGAIPTGLIESRFGGRNLLIIYNLGSVTAIGVILLSQTLLTLTLGLVLLGLAGSIYHPAGLTLISRRMKNISRAMAIHGVAGSLGLALGPIIAAIFTDLISWKMAYFSLAIANLFISTGLIFLVPKSSRKEYVHEVSRDGNKESKTNKKALAIYYLIIVLFGLSYAGITTFMPAHFAVNTEKILGTFSSTLRGGIFTTIVLLSGVLGQLMGGYLGGKYNRTNLVLYTILLNIPFMALLGITTGWTMVSAGIILGIVHFNLQPIGNTLIADLTVSRDRGLGYGISFFLNFGVGSIAAGISGVLAEHFGTGVVFPAMAIILVPGLFLVMALKKFHPG